MSKQIEPCPFNKDCCIRVGIFDDEGNHQGWTGDEYEENPFSGLQYGIIHDGECGLGYVVFGFKPTFEAIIDEWNTRYKRTCHVEGEWKPVSQTQEVRLETCSNCGYEFGASKRKHSPCEMEWLTEFPKFCPHCGAEVIND